MKKKIFALLAVFAMCLTGAIAYSQEADAVEIYVSEKGNDQSAGTLEAPLKTVPAAVSMASKYRAENVPVRIIFRGGTYRFPSSVTLPLSISGTKENSTTFESYEGEKAIFKGSVTLDASKAKPVTDPEILNRLYEHVRDKVVEIDLDAQGISQGDILIPRNINGIYTLAGWEDSWVEANQLYLNGTEQELSRWPNDRHYARWTTSASRQSFIYNESTPSRWGKAKDFWLGGFPEYDYRYTRISVKDVDTVNKTITVVDDPVSPYTSYMTRRWAAYNLLEEIDVPGEFYIDRDTMKLYYYPPHQLEGQTLEISLLDRALFDIRRVSNVTFKDISFSQIRSNAIFMENVDNIDFIGCDFKDVDVNGIFCRGTEYAITSGTHWEHQYKDASYNVDVRDCNFYNIGMSAVDIAGGNVDTLTESNNVIENCFIQRTSQKSFWESLSIRGCGVTVRNNNISLSPQQAIRPWGSLHMIEYNELYDVLRENDDCGFIYWGGNSLLRGTMVQYNYFHDASSIEPMVYNAKAAIYWDDGQSGMSAQYNIIANIAGRGLFSNGAGATLHRYNTSVNLDREWHFADHPKRDTEIVTDDVFATIADTMKDIYDKDLYYKKWPALEALSRGVNPKKFTEIYGNLTVNSGESMIGTQEQRFSKFWDNVFLKNTDTMDYNSIFVDPENQDFRIKSDSEFAKKNPEILNDKNFDIEKIGMTRDMTFNEETSSFRMLLPENGASSVSPVATAFAWGHAYGANHYRLVVATDPELKNVVYDDIVRYTYTTLDCLERGKTYYWTVYAINNSREHAATWQSNGKIHAFATAANVKLDTYDAENVLSKVKDRLTQIEEGNKPGEYKYGTVTKVRMYSSLLEFMLKKKMQSLTQQGLDAAAVFLDNVLNGEGLVNPGYLDLAEYFTKDNWTGALKVTNESVIMEPEVKGNNFGGTTNFAPMTGNIVYCFDAEFKNAGEGSFITFGLSHKNDVHQYQAISPGYYIVIKDNLVELQKCGSSGGKIYGTKEFALSDGKRHQMRMGRIKLATGNLFFVDVDGENLLTMYDIDGTEVTASAQLAMATYQVGEKIALYPYSGEIPGDESFNEMKKIALHESIKEIYNLYAEDLTGYGIISLDYAKVINAEGLYNVSYKPIVQGIDDVYVTKDAFEKLANCKVSVAGSVAKVSSNGVTVEVSTIEEKGVVMLPVKELCIKLNKTYTFDGQNRTVAVADSGTFVVMNTLTRTGKTREMFEVMAEAEDVIFNQL